MSSQMGTEIAFIKMLSVRYFKTLAKYEHITKKVERKS